MKRLLAALALAVTMASPTIADPEEFTPLTVERQHTITLDFPPDDVFAAMSPADGNHWVKTTPDYLFGSSAALGGAMWRVRNGFMLLTEYDPVVKVMRTVFFIPATEFMVEEIRCAPGFSGGTTMAVTWRVAGISNESNAAVQGFFDNHWERRMDSIEKTYARILSAQSQD